MKVHELSRAECHDLLSRIHVGHLACARAGQPYVVPIHFSFDADHSCLYAISPVGQKIDWMRENPKVCVEVEEIASRRQWTTVLVFGRFEELTREPKDAEARGVVERLFEQREQWWFPAAARVGSRRLGEVIIYRILIDRLTGRRTAKTPREAHLTKRQAGMSRATPEQVLQAIVDGINTGDLDALMTLYEPDAAFAAQPGNLAHGHRGVRDSLAGFLAMKGTLDLEVTRVLEAGGLALVAGTWSFAGTGADGSPVTLTGKNADVLRRQADGSWRFVIDNPWGTD